MKNMKQDDLAEALQCSRGYISKLESGRKPINLDSIEKISRRLDVPVEDLLVDGASLWNSNPTFRELMSKFSEEEIIQVLEHTQSFINSIKSK